MTARNPRSIFENIDAGNIASDAAITVKFLDGAVTAPKVEAALSTRQINIALSFASADELGTFKIFFPMKVTISKIRSAVTKVIGATSVATIQGGNASGLSVSGLVTIANDAAIGEQDLASPTNNNVVAKDSYYSLTTYKAGDYAGTVEVSLEYVVIE
jgi:hypothetical protein